MLIRIWCRVKVKMLLQQAMSYELRDRSFDYEI